jgi:hydroxymethylpyrimidine/phosphomethylpyrimidine kinase
MIGGVRTPRALTIAGSDSGGGAGIQADLKAFARCGVHGTSAITAITAQNTLGVSAVEAVAPEMILAQVRAVVSDIGVDVVKVGMLGTVEAVRAVASALDELPLGTPVIVDPVMVAESGAQLLDSDARGALVAEIVPRATVLTPNLSEARALAAYASPAGLERFARRRATRSAQSDAEPGRATRRAQSDAEPGRATRRAQSDAEPGRATRSAQSDAEPGRDHLSAPELGNGEEAEAEALARAVLSLGPEIVVLTGGHRAQATDLFLDSAAPDRLVSIPGERHRDGAAHGSGCTHSSLLAAQLALGRAPLQAAIAARALAGVAVADGLRDVGQGPGPVDVIGLARLRL